MTLIEPGAVATELLSHNNEQVQAIAATRFEGVDVLQAEDIANAIVYALSQPGHVAVNEILVRPSKQEG